MYREILVPLDESKFAELALPHASAIAKAFGARITIVTVVEQAIIQCDTGTVGPAICVPIDTKDESQIAADYLSQIATELTAEGVNAQSAVIQGDPDLAICDYAQEHSIDFIVMSTHGRSGVKRWVYGSVADRVLQTSTIPVMLVRK
jgi:nucleotide-binding universal stress UspA family protein